LKAKKYIIINIVIFVIAATECLVGSNRLQGIAQLIENTAEECNFVSCPIFCKTAGNG
jgi:hypothetical protein